MKCLAAMCLILALGALTAPALADDEKPTGDLAKVQGKWKGLVGPEQNIPLVLEIKDKKVNVNVVTPQGENLEIKGEILIDDKAKPKTWDWIKFTGPNGQEAPDNLAIYVLDGDTLKICSGGPNNPRPSEFKDGGEEPPHIITLMRVKDDKAK